MTGRIFHLDKDGDATPLEEHPYDAEKTLQELLATHPDLLAGEQINSTEPRRWLLVTREMAVPDEEDGGGKWSLDHLFLDQDGIPTLVEVKQSTNTDIRRKVVGQMLDYAANAVAYWPIEQIQAKHEARCRSAGIDSNEELEELLGDDHDPEDYWRQVKTNLQAGRIRLVFIADTIPAELRRIVEFLNEQMDPAEVLALEIKQYLGEGMATLVPRIIGKTETARRKKGVGESEGKQWNEALFMEDLQRHKGEASARAAKDMLDWITPCVTYIWWGSGKKTGGVVPVLQIGSSKHFLLRLASDGWFVIKFDRLKTKPPFDDKAVRRELLGKINELPNVQFDDDHINRRARIPIEVLTDETAVEKAKAIIEWMIGRVESSHARCL